MKHPNLQLFRAAVVGVGSMGYNHARIYSEMENVTLIAVADIDEAALYSAAARFHARPYIDFREMLRQESLDLVSIAVPTRIHALVAEAVIQHGVSVLIEKPLAFTVSEGEKIIELAERQGVRLGVGHVERFNPAVIATKSLLEQGLLGPIFQIAIRRTGFFAERIKDVGVFLDLATHDIDMMYHLSGSEVERICSESAQILHPHEDLAASVIRFENGVIGVMIENWLSPTKVRDIVINGERGLLVVDLLNQELCFYQNDYSSIAGNSRRLPGVTHYHLVKGEPLRLELEAFAQAVANSEPFAVTGRDGLRAVELAWRLAACARNRRTGQGGEG